jgi:malic enzyme
VLLLVLLLLLQANLGVAQLLVQALRQRGLSAADAKGRIWMVDSQGLITTDRLQLSPQKAQFAQDPSRLKARLPAYSSSRGVNSSSSSSSSSRRRKSREEVVAELAGVVGAVQPTALIGAAGVAGSFGQPVLAALLKVGGVLQVV